ncbi:hypothetical protein DNTS_032729 [Danionella cerebrum]|uniref:Receptor activity-modifying protein 2 n=1 Tax=Danionella cerebrum TaxID=2873325 RepID=A0A553NW07_9TELE|nr:hypothetical protein DNTS_032729 [Danionella translucida]
MSFYGEMYNSTHEDYEDFQDQESRYRYGHCDERTLMFLGETCWSIFNTSMSYVEVEDWCNLEVVVRSYNSLTECMETASALSSCYYPNRVVEQLFVRIHRKFFSSCNNEEDLADAPAGVVLLATLLPIVLIPFIVYIVVWKSSLKD